MTQPLPTPPLFPYTPLFRSLAEPVDFGSADGPADLILGIAAPAGTDDQHLQLLAQLSRALRSEEHTSELQSRGHLVCRLLLEKKNINKYKVCFILLIYSLNI